MKITDYFDQEFAVGDEVVYPVATHNSRGALLRAVVEEIVPLVPHRDGNSGWLMRADQMGKPDPTRYWENEHPKHYVLKVRPAGLNWRGERSKITTLRFTDCVISVPRSPMA